MPSTSDCACDAASIISPIRSSSRRIQRAGLGENLVSQSLVQRVPRHEVDRPADQLGKLVRELLDVPSEAALRREVVEHVDITVGRVLATTDRAENLEPRHPVAAADFAQAIWIDGEAGDGHQPMVGAPSGQTQLQVDRRGGTPLLWIAVVSPRSPKVYGPGPSGVVNGLRPAACRLAARRLR